MAKQTNNGKGNKPNTKGKGKQEELEEDEDGEEHGQKSSILDELDELQDDYDQAEGREGFSELDPGKYRVKIDKATINKSKSKGRLQVSFEMTVLGDGKGGNTGRGRKIFKHDGIDNEDSIGWFKGGMARLGLEVPKKFRDLPDFLDNDVIGSYAEVTVKHKPDEKSESGVRVNTYFDKALDSSDVQDDDDQAEDDETENEEVETPPVKEEKKGKGAGKRSAPKEEEPEDEESEVEAEDEDVQEEEPEAEDGDVEENADDEEVGEAEDTSVECKFDDKACKPLQKKIEAMAKSHDFDSTDYTSTVDLLADVAEFLGVNGEFKTPQGLIDAIAKAKK